MPAMDGQTQVPRGAVGGKSRCGPGPSMLRDENGMLSGYVYVDVAGRDVGSYVDEAKEGVRRQVEAAAGLLAGLERPVRGHAAGAAAADVVLPLTLFLILMLLYLNTTVDDQDADHHAGGAVLGGGRDLAAVHRSATT